MGYEIEVFVLLIASSLTLDGFSIKQLGTEMVVLKATKDIFQDYFTGPFLARTPTASSPKTALFAVPPSIAAPFFRSPTIPKQ